LVAVAVARLDMEQAGALAVMVEITKIVAKML
jgi:hypothetical protein